MLEANQDKINWNALASNPNAMHLLEANMDKFKLQKLFRNPAIFDLDYVKIRQLAQLHEELIAYVYHPTRVSKWLNEYNHEREYLE